MLVLEVGNVTMPQDDSVDVNIHHADVAGRSNLLALLADSRVLLAQKKKALKAAVDNVDESGILETNFWLSLFSRDGIESVNLSKLDSLFISLVDFSIEAPEELNTLCIIAYEIDSVYGRALARKVGQKLADNGRVDTNRLLEELAAGDSKVSAWLLSGLIPANRDLQSLSKGRLTFVRELVVSRLTVKPENFASDVFWNSGVWEGVPTLFWAVLVDTSLRQKIKSSASAKSWLIAHVVKSLAKAKTPKAFGEALQLDREVMNWVEPELAGLFVQVTKENATFRALIDAAIRDLAYVSAADFEAKISEFVAANQRHEIRIAELESLLKTANENLLRTEEVLNARSGDITGMLSRKIESATRDAYKVFADFVTYLYDWVSKGHQLNADVLGAVERLTAMRLLGEFNEVVAFDPALHVSSMAGQVVGSEVRVLIPGILWKRDGGTEIFSKASVEPVSAGGE